MINRPNPELWESRSHRQVYLTVLSRTSPLSGPGLTLTADIPDLDHYKGSFGGRVFPIWRNQKGDESNFRPNLLGLLQKTYGISVSAEDLMAYIAAIAAHPGFTLRFKGDLSTPGLRIPITSDSATFVTAVELGRRVIWLHTFGQRMVDVENGRPAQPPRLPTEKAPYIPAAGAIPGESDALPDTIGYDVGKRRLIVGHGYVENVEPAVWAYEVSGKQTLLQWFSYRKAHRDRPIIGERRTPSPLSDIQPDHWLPEYTTELINLLNVLGSLVELEPAQAELLSMVCSGPLISIDELALTGALDLPPKQKKKKKSKKIKPLELF